MSDLSDRTTVVVGASRGLGRGIAAAVGHAVPRPTQRRSFPSLPTAPACRSHPDQPTS